MTYETIENAQTMQPGGKGTLLAGRYRIVRQLGQGGMGTVWLVEDTFLDNKPFAVKMLPSILVSNRRAYAQLKAEALVAMKLTHPNIVTLRAYEENNGNPFLVMDYIDGQTLDELLGKGSLTEDDVLGVLRPIAAALDFAHSKGVVHRDVKPSNVMIAKDGTPYILDFGIAREAQETMTRVTGKFSGGTLLYMSPEQLNGRPPTKEQDIYSFAAMAYECLKGEPPFSRGRIEFQIINTEPEPLAGASVPFARAIMSGLAKNPEDRPKTCAAVLGGDASNRVEHVETWGARITNDHIDVGEPSINRTSCQPILEAEKVHCSDGLNAEVAKFEVDADNSQVPILKLQIKVEGRLLEAGESVKIGGVVWTTPVAWTKGCIEEGRMHGVKVAYERGGRRYFGTIEDFTADWSCQRTIVVELEEYKGLRHGDTKIITLPGGATMEMIYVAPGAFIMGSPLSEDGRCESEKQHRVVLASGYWLGKFEVTQRQWRSVMGGNPSCFKNDDCPVENISWNDSQEFIDNVNGEILRQLGGNARLPSEAEWECACRAGSTGPYGGRLDDMGWYGGNSGGQPHPVGRKRANAWGFCDMHGNVWEWCNDWLGDYNGDATDPAGPISGVSRVLRGGCWGSHARFCRSAYRGGNDPGYRFGLNGFRLCCTAEQYECSSC